VQFAKRTTLRSISIKAKTILSNTLVSRPIAAVVSALWPTRLSSMGITIVMPSGTVPARTRAMIRFGFYEKAEIQFVKRYLPPACDIVELGASLGVVSAHIGAKMDSSRMLLSVEANPNLAVAWHNSMADRSGNARLVHVAVGPESGGQATFWVTPDPLCSRSGPTGPSSARSIQVQENTLSGLLQEHGVLDTFALVADIEGAEAAFIMGPDQGALSRCVEMVIELHDTELDGVWYSWRDLRTALLSIHGFRVQAERGPVLALARDDGSSHGYLPSSRC